MSILPPSDLEGPAGENAAKNTAKNASEVSPDENTENSTLEPVKPEKNGKPVKPRTKAQKAAAPVTRFVLGNGDRDDIYLSKAIYKNVNARKSATVLHVQRRLGELGYTLALVDLDGWYGDHTKQSVAEYQKDEGLDVTGLMDSGTFESLFDGDQNVNLLP